MKTYAQACGLAKALDEVGDRWTLLIVRELLIRRACRYTDLRRGLPGIATNLLAERLAALEAAGLVLRAASVPPIATDLFSLTARGQALQPAILALGLWALRSLSMRPTTSSRLTGWCYRCVRCCSHARMFQWKSVATARPSR